MARKNLSDFQLHLLQGLIPELQKTESKPSVKPAMAVYDPFGADSRQPTDGTEKSLSKSIINLLNGPTGSIERLAFEADPALNNQYQSLYKQKVKLIPDVVLKRIMIQDDLVAAIINARGNHVSAFGRRQPDRHSKGFAIEPRPGVLDDLSDSAQKDLQDRIDRAEKRLATCGSEEGWDDEDRVTFSQYLFMSTKNAVGLGRIATEIIWAQDTSGQKRFHSFRPIDAGTILRAAPHRTAAQSVRQQAKTLLEQVKNKKLEPEKYLADKYAWVQVMDGKPVQAFTSDECVVHNFYPVVDVEMDGYPVTPLDCTIAAVTMHINITTHNKLYFQSGRAARGMLIIKSDDVDETVIQKIRQQFNASINSVANAWRMPVFGVGAQDDISWQPIDSGSRDMEFQYLSDTNARVILSAFQMSPEELPGYAHLSRGTNNQALAESNQEYLLTAHRDVGLRPLILQWQDFLNQCILPLFDPLVAKYCELKLAGLEAETPEKESIRLQQDQNLHMFYDEVLDKVDKEPIGKRWGGEFPFNPLIQAIMDKYLYVGDIIEHFFGIEGASKDPTLRYVRDQYWFDFQQMQMQAQQAQQQAQMQAAGGGQPPQGGGGGSSGGGDDSGGGGGGQSAPADSSGASSSSSANAQSADAEDQQAAASAASDLSRSIDQASSSLGKSEAHLPPSKRRLLAQQLSLSNRFREEWAKESKSLTDEILSIAMKA